MAIKKYSEDDYRRAIDRTAVKNIDNARKAGVNLTYEQAKDSARDQATRLRRKYEK